MKRFPFIFALDVRGVRSTQLQTYLSRHGWQKKLTHLQMKTHHKKEAQLHIHSSER